MYASLHLMVRGYLRGWSPSLARAPALGNVGERWGKYGNKL